MACGIPVVQPRSGAFEELIETTGGGLLCEPDSSASLADGLESLLNDPAKREAIGNKAMSAARSQYTSAAMAEKFEAVIQSLKPAA